MDRISSSGPAVPDVPEPPAEGRKRHFDTFETQFFKQGDEAEGAPEVDGFEDLEDGARRRLFLPSRRLTLLAGGACLLVLGCVALWRSGNRPSSPSNPPAVSFQPASASAAEAPTAVPAPAPATRPQAPIQPAETAAEATLAKPSNAGAAAAALGAAVKPAPSAPAVAAVAERPAPEVEQVVARPVPRLAVATGDGAAARARCKQAVNLRHAKEIQSACEAAFDADPGAADIAILLAKTEFDRGRSAQAASWSRKALAADPNAADAYVFIGGAEQSAGHNKAAKEAYKRYLQLAPGGRYAADLRAIVGSL
jgi:tetratricopeptide (TPR) repeat protein